MNSIDFDIPALQSTFGSNPKYLAEGFHQGILNIGFREWQNRAEWTYREMIEWVEQTYGYGSAWAILVGKYNQQVENGGHLQYFNNGYADGKGGCFNLHDSDHPLHQQMIEWFENLDLQGKLASNILSIMKEFFTFAEVDEEQYITEEEYDEDEEEYIEVRVENPDYGQLCDIQSLNKLDQRYYVINSEWMTYVEIYLAKKMMTLKPDTCL